MSNKKGHGHYNDPEFRKRMSEAKKKQYREKGVSQERIEQLRRISIDPECVQKRADAVKQAWADGKFDDMFTDEYRQKIREATSKRYEDPLERQKTGEASKLAHAKYPHKHTKETRKKMSESAIRRVKKTTYNPNGSKSARAFITLIEKTYNVNLGPEFNIDTRWFDAKYKNILLEIDGAYWHGLVRMKKIDALKEQLAKNNGFIIQRFIVNNIKEVEKKFVEYKPILDNIFTS